MISVIIPVFNVEKYLVRCVDSVLCQSYRDFEIVLVDDGSSDDSGKICDDYAEKNDNIRVIHQENKGLSGARNTGLCAAKGEYVYFLDSDDLIHSDCLKVHFNAIKKTGTAISIAMLTEFQEAADINYETYTEDCFVETFTKLESMAKLTDAMEFIVACNKLYKKTLFENISFPEGKVHEDEFVAHKLLHAAGKVSFSHISVYFYYKNYSGITKGSYNLRRLDALEAFEDRIQFYESLGLHELRCGAVRDYMDLIIRNYQLVQCELNNKKVCRQLKNTFKKCLRTEKESCGFKLNVDQSLYIFAYPYTAKILLHLMSAFRKTEKMFKH